MFSNACLLYTPECPQDYRAIGSFQNSYIHFQETTNILNQYDLPTNQIIYPQDLKSIDNLVMNLQGGTSAIIAPRYWNHSIC